MGLFSLLRDWRRKRTLQQLTLDDGLFLNALARLPFLRGLSPNEVRRLKECVILFLARKEFSGGGDFTVTDDIKLSIAIQAALPIMNLDIDLYDGWRGIIVYAGELVTRREQMDDAGVMHVFDDQFMGESLPGGPIVLAWEGVAEATDVDNVDLNVVIHEFAHKLDELSGAVDGVPPRDARFHSQLSAREWGESWQRTLSEAYRHFCTQVAACTSEAAFAALPIDSYGAEDPAEFFAVASESFFIAPDLLQPAYPALYAQLTAFYKQDPLARMQREG
jgi:MtfA peptidase